jgi:hypothetical protein
MSKRIISSLLILLVIVLSACALETPTPPGSVQTRTATPTPSPTATSIPSPTTTPTPTAETPEAGPCELVANTQTTVYQRPSLDADIFGTLSPGDRAPVGAVTADGWIGFDPGTAQAANVGVFRLRWVQRSDAISLEGACQDLPVVVGPPVGVCFTMAMEDIPVYSEPDASSALLVTLHSGDYAKVLGSAGDWFQLDLSVSSLGQNQSGWMSSQYVNFNGPCDSLPVAPTPTVPAATYTDPFAYCAAVGDLDQPDARYVGQPMPEAIAKALRTASGSAPDAPLDLFLRGSYWRCMDGQVYGCFVGANIPCWSKANTDRIPTAAETEFCKTQPNADSIPAVVTGHETIYEWRCKDGTPEIVRQVLQVDRRGFIADFWYELSPD